MLSTDADVRLGHPLNRVLPINVPSLPALRLVNDEQLLNKYVVLASALFPHLLVSQPLILRSVSEEQVLNKPRLSPTLLTSHSLKSNAFRLVQ